MEAQAAASEAINDIRKTLCAEQDILSLIDPDKELAIVKEVAEGYDQEEGHRSIAHSAYQKIGELVAMEYLEQKESAPEPEADLHKTYEAYQLDTRNIDDQIVTRRKAGRDVFWNGYTGREAVQ